MQTDNTDTSVLKHSERTSHKYNSIQSASSLNYIDEFNALDTNKNGYLNENQTRAYLQSQSLSEESFDLIMTTFEDGHITLERFIIIMHLLNLNTSTKENDTSVSAMNDENTISSIFSNLLRHCEESMKQVEKDKESSSESLSANKNKLTATADQLGACWRQLLQIHNTEERVQKEKANVSTLITTLQTQRPYSPDDEYTSQIKSREAHDANPSPPVSNKDIDSSNHASNEVMPGSFNFNDGLNEEKETEQPANNDIPPVAPPRRAVARLIDSEGRAISANKAIDENEDHHVFDSEVPDEKEPGSNTNSIMSFGAHMPQVESAKERSFAFDNDGKLLGKDDRLDEDSDLEGGNNGFSYNEAYRANVIEALKKIDNDGSTSIDDNYDEDLKRQAEILDEEDDDLNASNSLKATNNNKNGLSPLSAEPIMRCELFSTPSFSSDNVSESLKNDSKLASPIIPIREQAIDHQSGSTFNNDTNYPNLRNLLSVKDNQHDILHKGSADEKPTYDRKDVSVDDETIGDDATRSGAFGTATVFLNADDLTSNKGYRGDFTSENTSTYPEDASGTISPPPSMVSEVNQPSNTSNKAYDSNLIHPTFQLNSNLNGNNSIGNVTSTENNTNSASHDEQNNILNSPTNNRVASHSDRRHSAISNESRFIELDNDDIGLGTGPILTSTEGLKENSQKPSNSNTLNTPPKSPQVDTANTMKREDDLMGNSLKPQLVEKDMSTTLNENNKESSKVPTHAFVSKSPSVQTSTSEKPNLNSRNPVASSFTDKSAADAIEIIYNHMAEQVTSNTGEREHVLRVRKGFEGFSGIGIKCVSED